MGQTYSANRSRSSSGVRRGGIRPQGLPVSPRISSRAKKVEPIPTISHNVQVCVDQAYDEIGTIPQTEADANLELPIIQVEGNQ